MIRVKVGFPSRVIFESLEQATGLGKSCACRHREDWLMSSGDRTGHSPLDLRSGYAHDVAMPTGFWSSKAGLALIGGLLLVSEHRLQALGYLPYLLVLACPLLHLFHGGHGSHGAHKHAASSERNDRPGRSLPDRQWFAQGNSWGSLALGGHSSARAASRVSSSPSKRPPCGCSSYPRA